MRVLSQKWVESEHLPAFRKAVQESIKMGRKAPAFIARGIGLGDVVELVAKPIAGEIDGFTTDLSEMLGKGKKWTTKLAGGCSACSKRRAWLNIVVPNVRAWRHWVHAWRRVVSGYRQVYQACPERAKRAA